jgi:hypothetical protein
MDSLEVIMDNIDFIKVQLLFFISILPIALRNNNSACNKKSLRRGIKELFSFISI